MSRPVVLSPEAARMMRDASRITAHTPRGTRADDPPMVWNPPYIGFCQTPVSGIAATSGLTPGHAECSVYWGGAPDSTTLDRVLADSEATEEIYNPTTTAATGSTIYPFWRSNCGMLFIAPQGSTSSGGILGKHFFVELTGQSSGGSAIDFTGEWPDTSVYTHPQFGLSGGKLYANQNGYYFFTLNCAIRVGSADAALSAQTHFRTGITPSVTKRLTYCYCSVWAPAGDLRDGLGQEDFLDMQAAGTLQVVDYTQPIVTYMHRHGDTSVALDYIWYLWLSELMY